MSSMALLYSLDLKKQRQKKKKQIFIIEKLQQDALAELLKVLRTAK